MNGLDPKVLKSVDIDSLVRKYSFLTVEAAVYRIGNISI